MRKNLKALSLAPHTYFNFFRNSIINTKSISFIERKNYYVYSQKKKEYLCLFIKAIISNNMNDTDKTSDKMQNEIKKKHN